MLTWSAPCAFRCLAIDGALVAFAAELAELPATRKSTAQPCTGSMGCQLEMLEQHARVDLPEPERPQTTMSSPLEMLTDHR